MWITVGKPTTVEVVQNGIVLLYLITTFEMNKGLLEEYTSTKTTVTLVRNLLIVSRFQLVHEVINSSFGV